MKRVKNQNTKHGFTLVELLVVIAIIALLLSVLMPALTKVREQAKQVICKNNMRNIGVFCSVYSQDNNQKLPSMTDSAVDQTRTYNHWTRWFNVSTAHGGSLAWWNLGLMWKEGLVKDGKIFYCPSKAAQFQYKDYATKGFPTGNLSEYGTFGVRVSYSYNPQCISLSDRHMKYTRSTELKSGSILIADVITQVSAAHSGGWNILRGDNSAGYLKDPALQTKIKTRGAGLDSTNYALWDEIIEAMLEK